VPDAIGPYLDKVRGGAWRVVDADVEEVRAAGLSEDEIFEHTVATAVETGLARLEAALRVVE
jgi:alkylhydroperoxidase family enzyme